MKDDRVTWVLCLVTLGIGAKAISLGDTQGGAFAITMAIMVFLLTLSE